MSKTEWRCGPGGRPSPHLIEAFGAGRGLELSSADGSRSLDASALLTPTLRRGHARLVATREEEAALARALERGEPLAPFTKELLRGAIASRERAIAADEAERHARWLGERAARLREDSLSTDALRLRIRRQLARTRREAAQHRTEAFRLESLAHLARLPRGRVKIDDATATEQHLRGATEAYVWAEVWARLATSPEPHHEDVVEAWQEVVRELSAQLERDLPPVPRVEPDAPAPPSVRRSRPAPTRDERPSDPPAELPLPERPRDAPRPPPMVHSSFGARLVDMIGAGPRSRWANAWCPLCRTEYELPSPSLALHTHCACCRSKLIPHETADARMRPRREPIHGRCPHCSCPVIRTVTSQHLRCPSCATAITPVVIEAPLRDDELGVTFEDDP